MNENRHDKAWNDPPLFSLEQMSKTNSLPINKRHRYPQQLQQQQPQQPTYASTNIAPNNPFVAQQIQTNQLSPNQSDVNYEALDLNNFMVTVNTMIGSISNLPQDLIFKWNNTQSSLYSVEFENQTRINLLSLLKAIQSNDFNNARLYSGNLTFDSNQSVRTTALILSEILRYIP